MSQECFPTHPSTNSSSRKLRLKILTSDGKRFICPISYDCTIEELADRILKVYTQFQRDPSHSYHTSEEKLAKRIYNIRSHSYHLGRMDYVGDLLNDLDQIECDVEEFSQKDRKNRKKNRDRNKEKEKGRKEKTVERRKEEREGKEGREKREEKHSHNQTQEQRREFKGPQSGVPPRSPLILSRSPQLGLNDSIKKQSVEILELEKRSPQMKPLKSSVSDDKRVEQKPISADNLLRKSISPRITPIQSQKMEKLNLNRDSSFKKKNKEPPVQKQKEQTPQRDPPPKTPKGPATKETEKEGPKPPRNVDPLPDYQNRRKKSMVVVESQEQKQENSNMSNIYNPSYIDENTRKIFNRFDDQSD